jgi:hypothetical protein
MTKHPVRLDIVQEALTTGADTPAPAMPDREAVSQRLVRIAGYFTSQDSDRAFAPHRVVAELGSLARLQIPAIGFGDTFAIIGILLAVAAVSFLLARMSVPDPLDGRHRLTPSWGLRRQHHS